MQFSLHSILERATVPRNIPRRSIRKNVDKDVHVIFAALKCYLPEFLDLGLHFGFHKLDVIL